VRGSGGGDARSPSGAAGGWLGLIADTHGLLRPEAVAAFAGAERIVHAGDIGAPEVLSALREVAPVTAVQGNMDAHGWAHHLPPSAWVDWRGVSLYVMHDLAGLDLDPGAAGVAAVISGHSHRAEVSKRDGVLYVNPGSAGPRRFRLPVSVARLHLGESGRLRAEIVALTT
jgi:putative phosphoesterase